MGGVPGCRSIVRVYGADSAVHGTIHALHTVQKAISCNLTSNAPDNGCMYPKLVELRIHQ